MSPAHLSSCPNVPDCEQCPEFEPCTWAFMDDIDRGMSNMIFAGEISFHPADFIGHGDLLRGIIPA
jgi:hypothetical protein